MLICKGSVLWVVFFDSKVFFFCILDFHIRGINYQSVYILAALGLFSIRIIYLVNFYGISYSHKCKTLYCHVKGSSAPLKAMLTLKFLRPNHEIHVGLRRRNYFVFRTAGFAFQFDR